ncbi:MAG TPA: thioredoxin family protein [Myxococcota bacterium]|nr:thioredoxin family protein [Myxococcota bacterium]
MRTTMRVCTSLCVGFVALSAFGYYPGYDGYYPYPYSQAWPYQDSYSGSCPYQSSPVEKVSPPRAMPTKMASPQPAKQLYPKKRPSQRGTFEQRYPNLIVMFTKEQCPYCQYMMPIMKKMAMKFGKDIKFLFVDTEKNPQYPAQYGFSTVPQIMYFKNGEKLGAHGSADKTMTKEQVEEKIRNFFKDN